VLGTWPGVASAVCGRGGEGGRVTMGRPGLRGPRMLRPSGPSIRHVGVGVLVVEVGFGPVGRGWGMRPSLARAYTTWERSLALNDLYGGWVGIEWGCEKEVSKGWEIEGGLLMSDRF